MAESILEIKEKLLCGTRLEFQCDVLWRSEFPQLQSQPQSGLAASEIVVLYRLPKAGHLEGVYLSEGTVSVGYFWENRPYNVYHFIAADGQTLALYINISDCTKITRQTLHWRDLIIDVLVTPDGVCRVLDEHELPGGLEHELARKIQASTKQVLAESKGLLQELQGRSASLLGAV